MNAISRTLLITLLVLGVAPATQAAVDLGDAGNFAGLLLSGKKFTISSGNTVVPSGDVGIGDIDDKLDFSGGGLINGTIFAQTGETVNLSGGSTAAGGTLFQDMSTVINDALTAAASASSLVATQTFSATIDNDTGTIARDGSLTVIDALGGVDFDDTLTLVGNAGDMFVFNIPDGQTIGLSGGAEIILSGGLDPSNVLWNVEGTDGGRLDFSGNSITFGTFLAPDRSITVSGGVHTGAFIAGGAGNELKFQSGPSVTLPTNIIPEPASLGLLGIGALCLGRRPRRSK